MFKKIFTAIDDFRKKSLKKMERRLKRKGKIFNLKNEIHKNSHSIFWVWEFSKKAVLACFAFYIIIQIYAMTVMVIYQDFTNLGNLIDRTSEIVKDAIFAYLLKSGVENVFKIRGSDSSHTDEADG